MSDTYKTGDLSEAAFLLSQPDIQFVTLQPRNLRSYYFCFTLVKACEALALAFISGSGFVRARDYADAMRRAKDLVFAKERNDRFV